MDKKQLFLGVLLGVACSSLVNFIMLHRHRPPLPPPPWLFREQDFVNQFSKHLHLSEDQRQRISPFVSTFHQEHVMARKQQIEANIRSMETLSQSIDSFLQEDQRKQLANTKTQLTKMKDANPGEFSHPPLPPPRF